MKTFKKLIATILAVLMVTSIAPISALADDTCNHKWKDVLVEFIGDKVVDGKHYCQQHYIEKCSLCGETNEGIDLIEHSLTKVNYLNNDNFDERVKLAYEQYLIDCEINDLKPLAYKDYKFFYNDNLQVCEITYQSCQLCGYIAPQLTIEDTRHNYVTVTNNDYVAPTCSEDGHTATKESVCSVCHYHYTSDEGYRIPATQEHVFHEYDDYTGAKSVEYYPSTCVKDENYFIYTNEGKKFTTSAVCDACGKEIDFVNNKAIGHNFKTTTSKDGTLQYNTCLNKTNNFVLDSDDVLAYSTAYLNDDFEKDVLDTNSKFDYDLSINGVNVTQIKYYFLAKKGTFDNGLKVYKYNAGNNVVRFAVDDKILNGVFNLFKLRVDNSDDIEYSIEKYNDEYSTEQDIIQLTINLKNPTSNCLFSLRNNSYFTPQEGYRVFDIEYENCNYTETKELMHNYVETERVPSTCAKKGYVRYTCTYCGDYHDYDISLKEHTPTTVNQREATCSEEGYTGDTVCSVCNTVLANGKSIPKTNHDYETEVIEPTCSTQGYTLYTCKGCKYSFKADYTQPDESKHVLKSGVNQKTATCTEEGYTGDTICINCHKIIETGNAIPKTTHDYTKSVVEPTCNAQGYTIYTCKNCNNTYKSDFTQPDKSKHIEVVEEGYPATCTASGLTDGTYCSVCGDTIKEQEVIEPLGHKEVKLESVEPTCTTTGLTEGSKCLVCGTVLVEQKVIPKIAHTWDEGVITKAPTCTAEGVKTYHCTNCDATKTESVAKIWHSFGNNQPTCSVCGTANPNYVAPVQPTEPTTQPTAPTQPSQTTTQPSVTPSTTPTTPAATTPAPVSTQPTTTAVANVPKPKTTKIKKLKGSKKAVAITWSKVSSVNGYEIQIATDKKFKKNKKTVTIKKQKTTSTTVKKLKAKTKYYVRIRTYKTVNGKKVYSSWSGVKSVKSK